MPWYLTKSEHCLFLLDLEAQSVVTLFRVAGGQRESQPGLHWSFPWFTVTTQTTLKGLRPDYTSRPVPELIWPPVTLVFSWMRPRKSIARLGLTLKESTSPALSPAWLPEFFHLTLLLELLTPWPIVFCKILPSDPNNFFFFFHTGT